MLSEPRRMTRAISFASAAIAALLLAAPVTASALPELRPTDPLASAFLQFFYQWKSAPKDLRVSDLRLLDAGGELRVLCGAYELPGQARRPFLVLGDASPAPTAAWEPGSFPESDPLFPQLMNDLRLCQTTGAAVAAR
jgi:hypothetical protein